MAFYDNAWPAPGRQPWEQQMQQQQPAPPTPSRASTTSSLGRDTVFAFGTQFEEIDRAADNLMKSGKLFGMAMFHGRRDSLPVPQGRPYNEYDPNMSSPQRHQSLSNHDSARSPSGSTLQNFYVNQRHHGKQGEADQSALSKRRMAAQRERDLRNYHQDQQYNRSLATGTSDRSISPGGMTEEERRELIARQHRALYGNESNLYTDQPTTHQSSQDARVSTASIPPPTGARNTSPLAFDPFGLPSQSSNAAEAGATAQASNREQPQAKEANAGPNQSRSRANSTSPPSSNPTTSFALFENAQQSSRTSASSPGGSPPRQNGKGSTSGSVAPIGTRPSHTQSQPASGPLNPGLSRRSTTPLPSPLSFGFTAEQQAKISGNGGSGGPAASGSGQQQSSSGNSNGNNNAHKNHTSSSNGSGNGGGKSEDANGASNEERSASTGSNPSSGTADKNVALGWGSNSGVWGTSKNSLGVQASVWG